MNRFSHDKGWRNWSPDFDIASGAGQRPTIGAQNTAGRISQGRYRYDRDTKLVVASFAVQYGNAGTTPIGDSNHFLQFRLPIPAQRQMSPGNENTSDRQIGTALMSRGFLSLGGVIVAPIITADFPNFVGEDKTYFGQVFTPVVEASGTVSGLGGVTSYTATFPDNGASYFGSPKPSDLVIEFDGPIGTASWWVSSISAFGFTVTLNSSSTANMLWKLTMNGSGYAMQYNVATQDTPWAWGAQYDSVSAQLIYEAAS